jgi:gastric intrinsic factor
MNSIYLGMLTVCVSVHLISIMFLPFSTDKMKFTRKFSALICIIPILLVNTTILAENLTSSTTLTPTLVSTSTASLISTTLQQQQQQNSQAAQNHNHSISETSVPPSYGSTVSDYLSPAQAGASFGPSAASSSVGVTFLTTPIAPQVTTVSSTTQQENGHDNDDNHTIGSPGPDLRETNGISKALDWLKEKRSSDYGWANDTHMVILAKEVRLKNKKFYLKK